MNKIQKSIVFFLLPFLIYLGKSNEILKSEKFLKSYKEAFGREYKEDNSLYDTNYYTIKDITCMTHPDLCSITEYLNDYYPDDIIGKLGDFFWNANKFSEEEKVEYRMENKPILEYSKELFPTLENIRLKFHEGLSLGERERIKKSILIIKMILLSDSFKKSMIIKLYPLDERKKDLLNKNNVFLPKRFPIFKEPVNSFFSFDFKEEKDATLLKTENLYSLIHNFNLKYPSFFQERDNPDFISDFKDLISNVTIQDAGEQKKEYNFSSLKKISSYKDLFDIQSHSYLPDNAEGLLDLFVSYSKLILMNKKKLGAPAFFVKDPEEEEKEHIFNFNYNGRLLDAYSVDLPSVIFYMLLKSLNYRYQPLMFSMNSFDFISKLWVNFFNTMIQFKALPGIPYRCYEGMSEEIKC